MTTGARPLASSFKPAQSLPTALPNSSSRVASGMITGNTLAAQRQTPGNSRHQFISTYRDWPIWLTQIRVHRHTVLSRKCAFLQWQHPDDQGQPGLRYTYQIRPGQSLNQAIEIVRILIDQTIAIAQQYPQP